MMEPWYVVRAGDVHRKQISGLQKSQALILIFIWSVFLCSLKQPSVAGRRSFLYYGVYLGSWQLGETTCAPHEARIYLCHVINLKNTIYLVCHSLGLLGTLHTLYLDCVSGHHGISKLLVIGSSFLDASYCFFPIAATIQANMDYQGGLLCKVYYHWENTKIPSKITHLDQYRNRNALEFLVDEILSGALRVIAIQ